MNNVSSNRSRETGVRTYLSSKSIFYTLYIIGIIFLSLVATQIEPLYIVGAILGITALLLIIKYPFLGLFIYMAIYFLRLGERIGPLAVLRIELLFGVFLLLVILIQTGVRHHRIVLPTDKVSIALAFYVCALVASTFFSEWISYSYGQVINFLKIILFYYYIFVLADTEKRFQIVVWCVVGFTTFIGIEATLAYLQGNYTYVQGIMRAEGQTTYGENFNSLSLYMASTIPLLLYLMARYRNIIVKWLCLGMISSCFLAAVITGSRSGLLAIVTSSIVYIWFSRHRLAYLISLALLAIAVWTILPEQYRERYGGMTSSEIDGSSQGRLDAWSDGLKMFMEKPVFGVGPGVFTSSRGNRYGVWIASHSLYIELLATTGFVGTMAWSLFLFRLFGLIRHMGSVRGSPQETPDHNSTLLKASYAILAGLLVAGVFGHILVRDTWYLLAALLVAKAGISSQDQDMTAISHEPSREGTA